MKDNLNTQQDLEKLIDKIKEVDIAMMTTVDEDGSLRSRPMRTQQSKTDGVLWFFTDFQSHKILELQHDKHVNVSYSKPDDELYVSVSGKAVLSKVKEKIDELWHLGMKAWFPKGKDDPNIALIKVTIDKAEYWDTPSSSMVQLYGIVKATLTGERPGLGENEKINL